MELLARHARFTVQVNAVLGAFTSAKSKLTDGDRTSPFFRGSVTG